MSAAVTTAPDTEDGRHARRERNRLAVVDAMLALYAEGHLDPSSDQIAERAGLSPRSLFRYFEDLDDLVRVAVSRQYERVRPLADIDESTDRPVADRVLHIVERRLGLFDAMASAGKVSRLREPFQPLIAQQLGQARLFWRRQVQQLFAPEFAAMAPARAEAALATIDVLISFESVQLLRDDQGLARPRLEAALVDSITRLLEA